MNYYCGERSELVKEIATELFGNVEMVEKSIRNPTYFLSVDGRKMKVKFTFKNSIWVKIHEFLLTKNLCLPKIIKQHFFNNSWQAVFMEWIGGEALWPLWDELYKYVLPIKTVPVEHFYGVGELVGEVSSYQLPKSLKMWITLGDLILDQFVLSKDDGKIYLVDTSKFYLDCDPIRWVIHLIFYNRTYQEEQKEAFLEGFMKTYKINQLSVSSQRVERFLKLIKERQC